MVLSISACWPQSLVLLGRIVTRRERSTWRSLEEINSTECWHSHVSMRHIVELKATHEKIWTQTSAHSWTSKSHRSVLVLFDIVLTTTLPYQLRATEMHRSETKFSSFSDFAIKTPCAAHQNPDTYEKVRKKQKLCKSTFIVRVSACLSLCVAVDARNEREAERDSRRYFIYYVRWKRNR